MAEGPDGQRGRLGLSRPFTFAMEPTLLCYLNMNCNYYYKDREIDEKDLEEERSLRAK